MKIIEISSEEYPNSVAVRRFGASVVRGQTRPNGDVEIVRTVKDNDSVLTIIPKSKRAELAQFLVEAE